MIMSRLDRCFDLADIRKAAQRHLPKGIFDFVDRGAEHDVAMAENIEAFRRIKLRSRFLVDLSSRDMGTDLFGKRLSLPLVIAPTGAAGLLWYQGEIALAKAAEAAGIPFTLAAASINSMEQVVSEVPAGRNWFQFYMWEEKDLCLDMVERAQGLGYEALVMTIDTALGRTRDYNDRNGFTDPISLNARFLTDMALHPRWVFGVIGRYVLSGGMPRHENYPPKYSHSITRGLSANPRNCIATTWDDVARVRDLWKGPFIVKGLSTADDARKAADHGADAVVVSNHGGRALDSAPAPIDMLPEVAEAVGDRLDVLLDSGVRHGSDIVKALARGAKAVMIGRATLFGIAAGGQAGAGKVLEMMATQFEKNMGYVGCRTVGEIQADIIADGPAKS